MKTHPNPPKTIDEYIANFPEEIQEILYKIRSVIKEAAPDAGEAISYQMPTFKFHGNLVHFAAFKKHIGFYPVPSGIARFKEELSSYQQGKGSVKFPFDKPIPYDLIREIVRFRVHENLVKADVTVTNERNTLKLEITEMNMPADPPDIEGLSFRLIRGEEDAEAIYALRAGCIERDQVDLLSASESLPDRDEIRTALAEVIATHQQDHRLFAVVKGQAVGYSQINSWSEDDGRWVYLVLGWVLPDWRGHGLGTALLHWGEQTARRLAASDHPGDRFEFAANASSTQPEATALLLHEGYAAGYTVLEMGLDFSAMPPIHPLPAGIDVRPVQPEHLPMIAESIGEAYQNEYSGGRFQEKWTIEESIARLSAPRQNSQLWQVAWAGDKVVGGVLPLVEKGRAIMYDISVRPAWRRQGLARALLTRALWDLRQRGLQVIRLNTVAEFRTRARDLYTSVGFHLLKEFPRYRKLGTLSQSNPG